MNSSFERTVSKDEWLTPKYITDALGPFDLDPCASVVRPWDIAPACFTVHDNGLLKSWTVRDTISARGAFVWMNPPYGQETKRWFRRLAEHNHGIALTFARTETQMFFESVWGKATAIFFFKGRVKFLDRAGKESGSPGAPSCLIAYGGLAKMRIFDALRENKIKGAFIEL
jgi:hypothetical protein